MSETDDYEDEDLYTYQRLIVKLMYRSCGTKPDIAFAIRLLGRYNVDLRRSHIQVTKKVPQYLRRMMDSGIIYDRRLDSKILPSFELSRYIDSNFARDLED